METDLQQEGQIEQEFILEFPTELGIDSFLVKTKMPTLDISDVYYNPRGVEIWNDLNITILDVIEPSTFKYFIEWVETNIQSYPHKRGYVGLKKNLLIKLGNPGEKNIRKWILRGCCIKSFGDYDTTKGDIRNITF